MIVLFLINYHFGGWSTWEFSSRPITLRQTNSHRGQIYNNGGHKSSFDGVDLVNNEKMRLVYFSLHRPGLWSFMLNWPEIVRKIVYFISLRFNHRTPRKVDNVKLSVLIYSMHRRKSNRKSVFYHGIPNGRCNNHYEQVNYWNDKHIYWKYEIFADFRLPWKSKYFVIGLSTLKNGKFQKSLFAFNSE